MFVCLYFLLLLSLALSPPPPHHEQALRGLDARSASPAKVLQANVENLAGQVPALLMYPDAILFSRFPPKVL